MKGHIHHFATEAKWDELQNTPIPFYENTAGPPPYLLMWCCVNGDWTRSGQNQRQCAPHLYWCM